jgi:hypothetical protein
VIACAVQGMARNLSGQAPGLPGQVAAGPVMPGHGALAALITGVLGGQLESVAAGPAGRVAAVRTREGYPAWHEWWSGPAGAGPRVNSRHRLRKPRLGICRTAPLDKSWSHAATIIAAGPIQWARGKLLGGSDGRDYQALIHDYLYTAASCYPAPRCEPRAVYLNSFWASAYADNFPRPTASVVFLGSCRWDPDPLEVLTAKNEHGVKCPALVPRHTRNERGAS